MFSYIPQRDNLMTDWFNHTKTSARDHCLWSRAVNTHSSHLLTFCLSFPLPSFLPPHQLFNLYNNILWLHQDQRETGLDFPDLPATVLESWTESALIESSGCVCSVTQNCSFFCHGAKLQAYGVHYSSSLLLPDGRRDFNSIWMWLMSLTHKWASGWRWERWRSEHTCVKQLMMKHTELPLH